MFRNLSISLRIYLAIFIFNLLGMVATIIFTTIHFREATEKYHEERLLRKEQRIIESFDYLINTKDVNRKTFPDAINEYINEVADINNMDINVYDVHGNLIASNLGVENSLIQKRISSEIVAKVVLLNERVELDTVISPPNSSKETILKINSYEIFKNNNQESLGIINIPYVDSNNFLKEENEKLLMGLIGIIFTLILGSSILAWIISKSITKKVNELAHSLSSTDVVFQNKPLEYNQNDEIKPLVDSYNNILEKFKKQSQEMALAEREAAWKEMAKQVAHEIKNPLTPMRLMIQKYQMNFDKNDPALESKTSELTKTLVQQIDLLTSITDAFSDFAKMPNKLLEEINIVDTVEDAVDIFDKNWVQVSSDNPEIIANMDHIYLTRIITNLVKNAIQSIQGSDKKVEVEINDLEDQYKITINDNGSGIPKEIQSKIFQPKFTTKNSGMGLGLAIVKRIVEDYNGKIWFHSDTNGSTFYLQIPKFPND